MSLQHISCLTFLALANPTSLQEDRTALAINGAITKYMEVLHYGLPYIPRG